MTGIGWVGAMLYRGFQSSSPETAIEVLFNDLLSPRESVAPALDDCAELSYERTFTSLVL